jgi:hypothetical protein
VFWNCETVSDEVDLDAKVGKAGYPREGAFLEVKGEMSAFAVS